MLHLRDAPLKGRGLVRASGARITMMCEGSDRPNLSEPAGLKDHIRRRLDSTPALVPSAADNPAAVLVPIRLGDTPSLLLTLRADGLPTHAGQISFPGGRFQGGDGSFLETALRETEEETGIGRVHVEVAGFLDPYRTVTGYTVIPAVGFLKEGFAVSRNAREVAEIFEVPLSSVLDPGNHCLEQAKRNGVVRTFHVIRHGERRIWGATAGMIVNLAARLKSR
jgi:8-oxo-dGTP pyrophosphatase MutT (NUDIX family)